ncbi:MAG: hypothetical protein H7Z21_02370, partial [Hymenobacter sp.]|nr:hypothetical protein [Hymenobacter sp.]
MKGLFVIISLSLSLANAGFAQGTMPVAVPQTSATTPGNALGVSAASTLSDSTRQAVHKLFKRGRLYGTISAVSGGLGFGSGIGYAIGGESFRNTGFSLIGGATALVMGTMGMVQFSRRRER